MQEQGILLRGAMIYDAIHREPYASDIRVADGKIVEIGQGLEAHGERCIDAAGRRTARQQAPPHNLLNPSPHFERTTLK